MANKIRRPATHSFDTDSAHQLMTFNKLESTMTRLSCCLRLPAMPDSYRLRPLAARQIRHAALTQEHHLHLPMKCPGAE